MIPKNNEIYKHFKGNIYKVSAILSRMLSENLNDAYTKYFESWSSNMQMHEPIKNNASKVLHSLI